MGFFAMVFSFIIGILLIVFGFTCKSATKAALIRAVTLIPGFALVGLAVWLGLPK